MAEATVDVAELIETQPIGRFQVGVFVLCALACFASGFNDLALGYVAPSALSPAFAVLGIGNVLGVLCCGPIADRIGRKPVIIGAMLLSTPFVLAMAFAHSVPQLAVIQLFSSAGLMGLMPIALALAREYAPRSRRVTIVLVVFMGFAIGTIVAGLVTAAITESHSWRYVFVVNALLPCVVAPILIWRLPESLQVLIQRRRSQARVASIVARLVPAGVRYPVAQFVIGEKRERGFPVWLLFRDGRAVTRSLLWLMFFANVMLMMG